eukprot:TRINITY_DN6679_c0_g1_i2.p1 TRINITY_DN6679_c0_g1~~TRINITY_DN6679_c0_g1_i2.p1  ORF type:complete len:346 (+),score=97.54 TRINITY_DN6679_c0_g1_i2:97-1134(+)
MMYTGGKCAPQAPGAPKREVVSPRGSAAFVKAGGMQGQGAVLPVERPVGQPPQPPPVGDLRVVTFNIWFDKIAQAARAQAVVDILKQCKAHVICLQEVTAAAFATIRADPWVAAHCSIVDPQCSHYDTWYGVAILSTLPVTAAAAWVFSNSGMGRALLAARVAVGGGKEVAVGTVHLESLNCPRERAQQVVFSAAALKTMMEQPKVGGVRGMLPAFMGGSSAESPAPPPAVGGVLCGDFNFDSDRNFVKNDGQPLENDVLAKEIPAWRDAWPRLHPNTPGKTFDTSTNRMLAGHKSEVMRYDRVLSHTLAPAAMRLLGTDPIAAAAPQAIYPSDHYGLLAVFPMA